jgi:SAM-dependent methyltransferase
MSVTNSKPGEETMVPGGAHEVVWTPEKAEQFWNYFSSDPKFSQQYFSNHSGALLLEYLRTLVRFEGRVLDYGCGLGYLVGHMLNHGIACEALDFSAASIARVRQQFEKHPLFRGATVASGVPTPLPEKSIDLLLSVEMVEHLFDQHLSPTFSEFHRLLRPGGTLIVTTPNDEDLDASRVLCPDCGAYFHQYQHLRSWATDSLREAMESHGFETVTCHATLIARKPRAHRMREILRQMRRLPPPPQPHLIYIGRRPGA